MGWTKKQIRQHQLAAKILSEIICQVVQFIKNNLNITDVEVRKFIAEQYKKRHLVSDKHKSIVAFGSDTANVHFYAESPRKLKPNDLIMIDIWGRLDKKGAPFADITWIMYYGRKAPKPYVEAFKIVAGTRNKAIKYIKNNLKKKVVPIGKEIDAVARNCLAKHGLADKFLHGTGHALGFKRPHGRRVRINRQGRLALPINLGYTIEPGVYFKNRFGIRSEINFYIDSPREIRPRRSKAISRGKNNKLIITTKLQNKILTI